MLKAMFSQPMADKTHEEIVETRERAIHALQERGYEIVNTLFTDEWYGKEAMEASGEGTHVGIRHVRQRLDLMCHAILEVQSEPGKGTTVTIRIPKEVGA